MSCVGYHIFFALITYFSSSPILLFILLFNIIFNIISVIYVIISTITQLMHFELLLFAIGR